MRKLRPILSTVIALILAVFFLFGAYSNFFLNEKNAAAYAAWGYPDWFHYVTAILEFTTSMLLINRLSRSLGSLLGALVMVAASLTTVWNADYGHAVAPLVVLTVSLISLWLSLLVNKQSD
ncbi:DoxX family protein [Paenochrobactrum sp. BZR 588]|uniref:DoxX family protein n=1 Tax=Paenochrobactrum TaxID=999488 RepID=UPI0035BBAAE2